MNNFLSPKLIAGAAIVGIVGAAGVFIYEQVYAEKRRAMLVSEVQRLDSQMASMRLELQALRDLQKETQLKRERHKRVRRAKQQQQPAAVAASAAGDTVDAPAPAHLYEQSYTSDSEYFTDYHSVTGTDIEMDSEEFYDVPTDEEDDTLRESLNGHVDTVDDLDEDISDKIDKSPKSSPRSRT